jgi:lipopolysaccharide biosynthesis glycosyltransferase
MEKALYLDQDVLVLNDLKELWDQPLDGFPLAAVRLCRAEFRRAFNFVSGLGNAANVK